MVAGGYGEGVSKVPLFELPFPSTALAEEPDLATNGSLVLTFLFAEGGGQVPWRVEFRKVRAFRHRAESHCTVWHIEDAYDAVCRVEDSEWVTELRRDSSPDGLGWVMNHYLLTVDSWGCLEVVAESVEQGAM